MLSEHRQRIHGLVHCSGGGQTKALRFIDQHTHIIKDRLFALPPLFALLRKHSQLQSLAQLYSVFNMGHRMEVYVAPDDAAVVIAAAKRFGIEAQVIGRCEASDQRKLTIVSELGTFEYTTTTS